MSDTHAKPHRQRISFVLKVGVALLLGALAIFVGAVAAFAPLDGDKIVRGVAIAGEDVSLLTPEQALKTVAARAEAQRLSFVMNGKQFTIDTEQMPEIATHEVDDVIRKAQSIGRDGSPASALAARLRAAFVGVNLAVPHQLDRVALHKAVEQQVVESVVPAANAGFKVTFDANGQPVVEVVEATEGVTVNYDDVMKAAEKRLYALSSEQIEVPITYDKPAVSAADVAPLLEGVSAAILRAPFTLVAKKEAWTVSRATLADWIIATPNDKGEATLALDEWKIADFLKEKSADISTKPIDAIFEEKDGKVTKFVPHVNGVTVDAKAATDLLTDAAFDTGGEAATSKRIELPMTEVEPEITTEKSNPYGIKEIVGTGASNFRGSPANRRHNIAVGATSVNGTLIAPDTEFSMIKTLGVIDGTSGYKQELVIKENRTTPEYGGGLCQIGSTAFRAALDTGLPITMRQNHSYRVPYYERDGDGNNIGPGKDATIYDPLPDFRFKNDTGHYILITTAITGDKVTFTFWGTKDGRTAEQTRARVYNIVEPPPRKVILTTEIPPGTTKCTESAHVGSDASFTYTVHMPTGESIVKEFVSHYRPWQEVCLEGVEPSVLPPGVTSIEKSALPPAPAESEAPAATDASGETAAPAAAPETQAAP